MSPQGNFPARPRQVAVGARTTLAFAAIGDHQRLPWRFFARLFASDGSLIGG
ncbi:hypothetical protein [Afifella sp. IM 167]|uniref:hypothetical protein n=1 Tax=Afifella sp. IM 167 TaxID=2033586 RepID=UPI001CCB1D00|nr:hypothetical protein [Afifella sp. IM 167]